MTFYFILVISGPEILAFIMNTIRNSEFVSLNSSVNIQLIAFKYN